MNARAATSDARTFSREWAREYADISLSRPPLISRIERPAMRGELVASFVLPLELCKPQNATRHAPAWMLGKLKRDVFDYMSLQAPLRREPLSGRPQVICVRFSCVEPDAYNDGFKIAVDALGPMRLPELGDKRARKKLGLGFIVDDSPRHIDLHQRWEPAPQGYGFGLVQVWTGKAAA